MNIGTPFICSESRTFICKPSIDGTFITTNGEQKSGKISLASIFVAAFYVKKTTREPVYSHIEDTGMFNEEDGISSRFFDATVDPVFGAVIIPRTDTLRDISDDLEVAVRINGYSLSIGDDGYAESYDVPEAEFSRIVTENYDKFNNIDNISGQCDSYCSMEVADRHPRTYFCIGYETSGQPAIVPYEQRNSLKVRYGSANTVEQAEKVKADIAGISLSMYKKWLTAISG